MIARCNEVCSVYTFIIGEELSNYSQKGKINHISSISAHSSVISHDYKDTNNWNKSLNDIKMLHVNTMT